MAEGPKSEYEGIGLRAVRPYLIVSNGDEAIDFYRRVFDASGLERHTTPAGGVAHAKLQVAGIWIRTVGRKPSVPSQDVDLENMTVSVRRTPKELLAKDGGPQTGPAKVECGGEGHCSPGSAASHAGGSSREVRGSQRR